MVSIEKTGSKVSGARQEKPLGMFTAYFDASGNAEQSDSFIVVSGYIANSLQWRMFENVWKQVHQEFGMKLPFHMSEFIASTPIQPIRFAK